MREKLIYAGIIGTVAVFAVTMMVQGVKQLYVELQHGRETLNLISRQVEWVDADRQDAIVDVHGQWYVDYGRRIAALLEAYPRLATREMLQSYCDDLTIDYIALFDDSGSQALCSRDYSGLTLDRWPGQSAGDFRRLLQGMPSIVHEASMDAATGQERQMIGVKTPSADDSGRHGALIMALMPDRLQVAVEMEGVNEQLSMVAMDGTVCFTASCPGSESGATRSSASSPTSA